MSEVRRVLRIEEPILDDVRHMGELFYKKLAFSGEFHFDTFRESWNNLCNMGAAVMFGAFQDTKMVGAIGGVISMHMFDGKVTAQECFWFVDPNHRGSLGLKLLRVFEQEMKKLGCERISMSQLDGDDSPVARVLEKRKYRRLETCYVLS